MLLLDIAQCERLVFFEGYIELKEYLLDMLSNVDNGCRVVLISSISMETENVSEGVKESMEKNTFVVEADRFPHVLQ